jgi:hypothetical protein
MLLILISLFFIILFGLLGALNLSYAIYCWEKNRVEEITKNFMPQESNNLMSTRAEYSSSILTTNVTKFKKKMKVPKKIEDFYQSSMVILSQQDYKGMFNKIFSNFKKITSNLGLYAVYSFNYIVNLIKKSDTNVASETKIEVDNSDDIIETIKKVKSISKDSPSKDEFEYINITEDKIEQSKPKNATIDLVTNESDDKSKKDKKIYNQLEDLILEKLKTNGMDCWQIWMELAAHYERYKEFDKAVEIFAMVMKNSKGPEKNIAKDKLIALS